MVTAPSVEEPRESIAPTELPILYRPRFSAWTLFRNTDQVPLIQAYSTSGV